ncbi:MAG: DNA damage-inducible protein D [Candidatus Absconditabacteria bacterium]|nr:DNA damage-inducible protein D [Candidatus Absconditabacteria bacterium]MDD3262221.1 DNA damage-inducible protein D [Candidatus Absconditabacteria bacterium]
MDELNTGLLISKFDNIKNIDSSVEWRRARDLQKLLGYTERRNFFLVIEKAKESCKTSGSVIKDHFVDVNKPIIGGKGSIQLVEDFMLSRFACYLIAQNGDPRKQEIAFAQAYFATQTRKQEILEKYMVEHQRLLSRQKLKNTEAEFQKLAYERGVNGDGISRIRSKGDTVLFGGKTTQDMKKSYGIKSGPLADYLPEVTIKAKDLATEVTNYNMKNKNLKGEDTITHEHIKNNQGVREYLIQSGIKPEELPPSEDIKKIERRHKKDEKIISKRGLN